MATVDKSRLDRLLNAEDPPDAVERGVTYEFLERLLRKQKLHNLTTRQVVKQYVVPQTFNSKCSLSGLLRQIHPQSVGRATHYVVHPWDGSFERLVSALGAVDGSHDDEEGNPPYFWIDVFALNQRQQVEGYKREEDAWLHRDEMFGQLRTCMRTIDKIVVIVDPVFDPIVMKRAWCMFECSEALHQGREVMLCAVPEPPDCDPFLDVVFDFEKALENYRVNFNKCESTIPIDKEWLDKEASSLSALGAKWVDEHVGHEFLAWLGDRAAGRVLAPSFLDISADEANPDEIIGKRLLLMQSLSRLLASLDRAEKAREIIEKSISRAQVLFGPEEERILSMKHDLACLSAKYFKELKKADHQLRHILALRQRLHGEDHPLVVESMEALGRVLKERRKLTEAISLFRTVQAIREKTLGPTHFETLVILNILALTLQKREHYKEAEKVFRRVVSTGIDTLGATNLDVMVWSNNLAVLYQDTKQHDKAEILLRTTLRNAEHSLGPTHPHTLTLVFNLGYCLWHQGRVRAAEGFFRRELAGCEATKGPDHRDTQRSRQNLARLLTMQKGREKEAEAILKGDTKPKDDSPSAASSPTVETNKGGNQRRVAIMNPEVQPPTPERHGHLVKVAAGLSALPPPRGVDSPRLSSSEWADSAALPKEYASSGFRGSPVSDGDDRTADDTTGEDRSQSRPDEDEAHYQEGDDFEYEDGGGGTEDEAEYYEEDDDLAGNEEEIAEGTYLDDGDDEHEAGDDADAGDDDDDEAGDDHGDDDEAGDDHGDDGVHDEGEHDDGEESVHDDADHLDKVEDDIVVDEIIRTSGYMESFDESSIGDIPLIDNARPTHRRLESNQTTGTTRSEWSEQEDVVEFEEHTLNDSSTPPLPPNVRPTHRRLESNQTTGTTRSEWSEQEDVREFDENTLIDSSIIEHDNVRPTHRRLESTQTTGTTRSEWSEQEDVAEFEEHTLNDSIPISRDLDGQYGRQRREQTVTSDDELLVGQLQLSDEEDDEALESDPKVDTQESETSVTVEGKIDND